MELILDYSKWKSGKGSIHGTGKGLTSLLNPEGYMCCLGQFALQLGFSKEEIRLTPTPNTLKKEMHFFNRQNQEHDGFSNTELTCDCVVINDDFNTSASEKIRRLTERLAKENITLKVINLPNDEKTS